MRQCRCAGSPEPLPFAYAIGTLFIWAGRSSSIGCASAWYVDDGGFDPHFRQSILSLRFGHEKISLTILSLPLIQGGQLLVTGERMGTKYWYTAQEACPGTVWLSDGA